MPVLLGRPSQFFVELCGRLEDAAGVPKPSLDRMHVQETVGPKLAELAIVLACRRNPDLRTRPASPETAAALFAMKRLVRAIRSARAELCELERYSALVSEADGQRLKRLHAAMDDVFSAFMFSQTLDADRRGKIRLRHRRRRGRPRDEVCTKVAEALVPLWKRLSPFAGVWFDSAAGEWRGPLLDVAIWTLRALGVKGIGMSRTTLAKELRRRLAE